MKIMYRNLNEDHESNSLAEEMVKHCHLASRNGPNTQIRWSELLPYLKTIDNIYFEII